MKYRASLPATHFGGKVLGGANSDSGLVNTPQLTPSITGVAASIDAVGDDTNIDLKLVPKGTGAVVLAGSSATPLSTSTADKKFTTIYSKSTAATGDSRGEYIKHEIAGAGSGEALRAWTTVSAANAATGGTVNGAHLSLSVTGASGSVSGQGHAVRATLGADAQTRTLNANLGVVNLDSDIATGNTVPNTVAFTKVTNTGAVKIANLVRLPNASNGTIFATHTDQAMTHSIKCVTDDGTVFFIMCTTTATGRG